MTDVLDYFPFPKMRPAQRQAILDIAAAFDAGKRFVIFQGPPGSGKSLCSVTLAHYYRSAYICTLTKQLMSQYSRDFPSAVELKGRTNFSCVKPDADGIDCSLGELKYEKKAPCGGECPYRQAKAAAVKADLTLCNYASYLYIVGRGLWERAAMEPMPKQGEMPHGWSRPLLVLDEAHESESVLLDWVSVTMDTSRLPFKGMPAAPSTVEGCFAWLELFAMEAERVEQDLLTAKARKECRHLRSKAEFALDHRTDEWIYEPLEKDRTGFCLKPLTVRSFGERLFQHGEKVLLMSATILDAAKMAESLGIPESEYAYVEAPCTFPVDNRPVIVSSLNMTKAHRSYVWPAMVDQVGIIMNAHDDVKGLILTPSNEMMDFILANLPEVQRRRLILARGADRLESYQRHLDAKTPTVLMASGFWEGADLKEDYSRFQILPAIPRPYWGGQIAARAKLDPVWYRWKAFTQLCQGVGRSVRSESDTATTYVLDRALRDEAARSDTMLPEWFKEALIYA